MKPKVVLTSETWRKDYPGFDYLLTPGDSSTKTEKSNRLQQDYYNVIQYLAPGTMAEGPDGRNLCPSKTPGCYGVAGENCIAGSGQLRLKPGVLIGRTKFWLEQPELYLERLHAEIDHFFQRAKKAGLKLALRLNGTSDIAWERLGSLERFSGYPKIFDLWPDILFYDYTKVMNRVIRDGKQVALPKNYHLTFSASEKNQSEVEQVIRLTDVNVARVFPLLPGIQNHDPDRPGKYRRKPEDLQARWGGREVIDGDKHDLRFPPFDKKGVIVGLRAKGELQMDVKYLRTLTGQEKKLRVLTQAEVDELDQRGLLTPGLEFMLKDSGDRVMDSRMDDSSLRRWLEKVAEDFGSVDRVRRESGRGWVTRRTTSPHAGPWSTTIGRDVWSFATNGRGILGVRRNLDYPAMPRVVSDVILARWLEGMLKARALHGTATAAQLIRFAGGVPRRPYTPNSTVVPVAIGTEVFDGLLIASSLRGAIPSEPVRVESAPIEAFDMQAMLFLFGAGWIASQLPIRWGDAPEDPTRYFFPNEIPVNPQ